MSDVRGEAFTILVGAYARVVTSTPEQHRSARLGRRARFARRWRHRVRVLEAMALMTAAGAAQKWVPMTSWSWVLGISQPVPQPWSGQVAALPSRAANITEFSVASAIRRGTAHLPWKPTCLAEATAGQIMLRVRRDPGLVVIGLRRKEGNGPWDAHAWLIGGEGALTGGPAARGFTATSAFGVQSEPENCR